MIGSFNDWGKGAHPLCRREKSGIWEGFLPGVVKGTLYKFQIRSRFNGYEVEKPIPSPSLMRFLPRLPRSCGTWTIRGAMSSGWQAGTHAMR